jgi:hypothetical protein
VVELPFAADCCPCVENLRTVLPFTVGIRDGAVYLVSTLGSGYEGHEGVEYMRCAFDLYHLGGFQLTGYGSLRWVRPAWAQRTRSSGAVATARGRSSHHHQRTTREAARRRRYVGESMTHSVKPSVRRRQEEDTINASLNASYQVFLENLSVCSLIPEKSELKIRLQRTQEFGRAVALCPPAAAVGAPRTKKSSQSTGAVFTFG